MWDCWTAEQEAWLRRHAGTMPIDELAAAISAEFGVPRNEHALRIRAKLLEISLWVRGWSMGDVERLFRVDHRVIVRWWITPGLLIGRRWSGRGPNAGWWFEEADVERFIRSSPWAYDAARMAPGHRLTLLATVTHRADPWLSREELAKYLGTSKMPIKTAMARGLIPHKRRYGAGGLGECRIRAADFASIAEKLDEVRRANRRRGAIASLPRKPQCQPGYQPRQRANLGRRCRCGAAIVEKRAEPAPMSCAFCGRAVRRDAA